MDGPTSRLLVPLDELDPRASRGLLRVLRPSMPPATVELPRYLFDVAVVLAADGAVGEGAALMPMRRFWRRLPSDHGALAPRHFGQHLRSESGFLLDVDWERADDDEVGIRLVIIGASSNPGVVLPERSEIDRYLVARRRALHSQGRALTATKDVPSATEAQLARINEVEATGDAGAAASALFDEQLAPSALQRSLSKASRAAVMGRVYRLRSTVYMQLDELLPAIRDAGRARKQFEAVGDVAGVAELAGICSGAYRMLGEYAKAHDAAAEAVSLTANLPRGNRAYAATSMLLPMIVLGENIDALVAAKHACDVAAAEANPTRLAEALLRAAQVALNQRKPEAAGAFLDAARLEMEPAIGKPWLLQWWRRFTIHRAILENVWTEATTDALHSAWHESWEMGTRFQNVVLAPLFLADPVVERSWSFLRGHKVRQQVSQLHTSKLRVAPGACRLRGAPHTDTMATLHCLLDATKYLHPCKIN